MQQNSQISSTPVEQRAQKNPGSPTVTFRQFIGTPGVIIDLPAVDSSSFSSGRIVFSVFSPSTLEI